MKVYSMRLNAEPFALIERGEKSIELRLNDEKRQQLCVGDEIIFTHAQDGKKTLRCKICALHSFPNFQALYAALPLLQCGYTKDTVALAHPSDMEAYYSQEEQKKYGVLGIEIRVL